jgi:hypothetical protein
MKWILVITVLLSSGGEEVERIAFPTETSCEDAKKIVLLVAEHERGDPIMVYCIGEAHE